ncbi:hypothetical protein ABFB09_06490 [Dehalogenimonas sp. THU2]|uniref:hypothetical protein n=1 Tax=Dehalogenimonas sp. THU2 TaxID=3151121 RepID=UPI0032182CFC
MPTQNRYREPFLEFIPYLSKLDMPTEIVDRCRSVFERCSAMSPEPVAEIFISETLTDGKRKYDDLMCFSANYCVTAKDFTRQIDIFLLPITKRFTNYPFVDGDYVYNEVRCDPGFVLLFKAVGYNFECMTRIFNKYIEPNLAPPE